MLMIAKTDADRRLVFGWANVAVDASGRQITDRNGHVIDGEDLEDAAYEFVLTCGEAGEMHEGDTIGRLVESLFVTPEKLTAMGLEPDGTELPHAGWWVGFEVSPEAFAKVKDGTYTMFSIQGFADREPVQERENMPHEATPVTTANALSVNAVAKIRATYPGLPFDQAFDRWQRDHAAEAIHVAKQTASGRSTPYVPTVPAAGPSSAALTKRADAERRILKRSDMLRQRFGFSKARSIDIAARVDYNSLVPSNIREMSDQQIERLVLEAFRDTRDPFRREADRRAAEVTLTQLAGALAELLNRWDGD